jgi:hypothetical protein
MMRAIRAFVAAAFGRAQLPLVSEAECEPIHHPQESARA